MIEEIDKETRVETEYIKYTWQVQKCWHLFNQQIFIEHLLYIQGTRDPEREKNETKIIALLGSLFYWGGQKVNKLCLDYYKCKGEK